MQNDRKNAEYEQVGELIRIFQRGEKWYANFQADGKQHRQSLKTASKKEAWRRALIIERKIVNGEFHSSTKPPSVEQVIAQYEAYLKAENRAPKTLVKYTKVLERVVELAERLHRRNMLGIDLAFLDAFRQQRAVAERSPKTIYVESMIIRQLVNFALTRRLITTDPLRGVKIREPKPTRQPCWTPAQLDQILGASRPPQRDAFRILAETGLRVGELIWLTWDDIDFEHNVLQVRPKEGWKPKTGDQRAVPLSPRLLECLQTLPRIGRWVMTAGRSRRHPKGDGQLSERRLLRSLKRVLKGLKLPGHLHTFRHAFISRALASGIPESQVRAWVGHVDRDVIKLYTHIADCQSQQAMQKLSSTSTKVAFANKDMDHDSRDKDVENPAQIQHIPPEPIDGIDAS
jgi:integrase